MVQIRKQSHIDDTGSVDLELWLQSLRLPLGQNERDQLTEAAELIREVGQSDGKDTLDWSANSDSFVAGLDIAQVLADLHVDSNCLIAGLLYRSVIEEKLTLETIRDRFGHGVADLISGVSRMAAISQIPLNSDSPVLGQATDQKDNIRKMLIAMVDDVRVALIKLAERTTAIRMVKNDEARRQQVGQEVFDIYAPLAHRLGIGQLKWELEDLSFRYIYADAYRKIAGLLDGKRIERDAFIQRVIDEISQALARAGLDFEIGGRAKHIYSIWRKMQRKGIGFSQVYDVRAVRILVPQIQDCYATLGLVHGLWRNIPNEFDDYIANPKENGYRSLHTAVIGPAGKVLEVQIRTHQMHEEAELGVCAHWRYKGSDASATMASTYEEKIAWLRQVLDWHEETGDSSGVAEEFSFDVAQDRVYVFTPDGDVVNLAQGATPLDFAYHVHTEIGHRCRGAKVNGSLVPLTYTLQTGQRVEILTSGEAMPRRDWLQTELGYIKTTRARAKVQYWFRGQTREENVDAGRHLLEKHFRNLELTSVDYQRIARKLQYATVDDMYAAAGSGDISSTQALHAAKAVLDKATGVHSGLTSALAQKHAGLVRVSGQGHLMSHIAGCCKPVPGDDICGFVTKGRGVSIHRSDCLRLKSLRKSDSDRFITVAWQLGDDDHFEAEVIIEALDRQGLLRDITGLFANARINVLAVNTQTHRKTGMATMRLQMEVPNLMTLNKMLERIDKLTGVVNVRRFTAS